MTRQAAVLGRPIEVVGPRRLVRRLISWWIRSVAGLRPPVELR